MLHFLRMIIISQIEILGLVKHLLDCVVASKMVHHVSFGAEGLAAVLRALKWSEVVVNPHVYRQIVAIIEGLATGLNGTDEFCPALVIGQMSFQELLISKLFLAPRIVAHKYLFGPLSLVLSVLDQPGSLVRL